jgi:hypothetical protein
MIAQRRIGVSAAARRRLIGRLNMPYATAGIIKTEYGA